MGIAVSDSGNYYTSTVLVFISPFMFTIRSVLLIAETVSKKVVQEDLRNRIMDKTS
jgi:hypothetical protein